MIRRKISGSERFTIIGAAVCFVLFSVIIAVSGFSLGSMVNAQNMFLGGFLSQNSVSSVLSGLFGYILAPIVALLFLVLGFALLSSYGYHNDKKFVAFIPAIIGAIAARILFRSVTSLFVAAGMIIGSVYTINISNVYAKELKKWSFFRTGSNSISKALMVFNVLVFIGLVLAVYASLPAYQQNFRHGFVENVISSTPGFSDLGEVGQQQLRNYIESTIDASPLLGSFLRWLPLIVGFGAWVVLEFLRTFVFSNIGGIFTSILIRINKRF